MASEGAAISMLVLRLIALAASVAKIVLVITNKEVDFFYLEFQFPHIIAFRYVVAVAAISAANGIIQLPFAVYYALKHKRLIPNGCLPYFDFIADKVISLLLATEIGVGLGWSCEAKRGWERTQKRGNLIKFEDAISNIIKFYDREIIASSILALACLCMALVSVISSINRSQRKGGLFNRTFSFISFFYATSFSIRNKISINPTSVIYLL